MGQPEQWALGADVVFVRIDENQGRANPGTKSGLVSIRMCPGGSSSGSSSSASGQSASSAQSCGFVARSINPIDDPYANCGRFSGVP